jgi:ABC-type polar amino acid transport system ATPase subunit
VGYSRLNLIDNQISCSRMVDRGRPDSAMRQRAEELVESVGLTPWRDNLATNMSGGQQQRVAVARALARRWCWRMNQPETSTRAPPRVCST